MRRLPTRATLAVAAALLAIPAASRAQKFTATKVDIGGEGAFDYLSVDTATGRVFVSRGTRISRRRRDRQSGGRNPEHARHARRAHREFAKRGFTTNGGDSTSTMFDLKTLAIVKKIHAGQSGLDGIMYDDATTRSSRSTTANADGRPRW